MSEGSSGEPDLRAGLARDTYCLKLRKHLRDGRENRPHHPQARWAVSGSSIASGTKRRREISPVALQHLARSRLRSPVLRAQNLKKKKKRRAGDSPRSRRRGGSWRLSISDRRAPRQGPRAPSPGGSGWAPSAAGPPWPGCRPTDARPQGRGEREEAGGQLLSTAEWGGGRRWRGGRRATEEEVAAQRSSRRRRRAAAPRSRCSCCWRPGSDWPDAIPAWSRAEAGTRREPREPLLRASAGPRVGGLRGGGAGGPASRVLQPEPPPPRPRRGFKQRGPPRARHTRAQTRPPEAFVPARASGG